MKRVTGIGGLFFQSESPEHLYVYQDLFASDTPGPSKIFSGL